MDELQLEFGLDYFQILEQDNDCMLVDLDLLHLGKNRNMCDISKECVEKSLPTFFNKPIVYRLNSKYYPQSSTDVEEHARNTEEEKLMYIAGTIPESSPVKYIERNNKTYLRMSGVIHKHYQPILVKILKNRNGEVKVSIEIKAKGQRNEEGIFVIEEFIFMAVCLLNKDMQEGIEGSQMVITKFSLEDYNNHYLSFSKSNNSDDSYKIPVKVKENAQKGLDMRKKYGRGGTSVGINMAKYIVKNEYATFEKVNKISQYFPRHAKDNLQEKDPPSNGLIAWNLWGSDEGWKWSKDIVEKKEKEGEEVENSLETFIAKEELGSKDAIEIDKSKDSMSESEWGEENKSQLKKECLMASNYKTVCKAVFLKLEDGWEEGKEGSLGYPVMEKKSDAVVYNRYGLGSAKEYAEKNNEMDVLSELKKIYKQLDLPWDGEELKNTKKEGENLEENIENVAVEEPVVEDSKQEEEIDNSIENEDMETLKNKCADAESKFSELEMKYKTMEDELTECKNKLATYMRNEELSEMTNMLNEFAHCFSEEDLASMNSKMSEMTKEEFTKQVDTKAIEYAKTKKETPMEEEIKNSYQVSFSNFGINDHFNYGTENKTNDLDSILKKSDVKIKLK